MAEQIKIWKAIDGSFHEKQESAEKADFFHFLEMRFQVNNLIPSTDVFECLWQARFDMIQYILPPAVEKK